MSESTCTNVKESSAALPRSRMRGPGVRGTPALLMGSLTALCLVFSLSIGTYSIPFPAILKILMAKVCQFISFGTVQLDLPYPPAYEKVLLMIRLPRVLTAMLVGGALAVSGTVLQSTFRNALVDSYIVGISAGAAFGATLGFGFFPGGVEVCAFLFAMLAMGMTYTCAKIKGSVSIISLILAGIVMNALFMALASMLKLFIERERIAGVVYWLMGSFSSADWHVAARISAPLVVGFAVLLLLRWRLNVLSMGDEAWTLGIDVEKTRLFFILVVSGMTGAAVAHCGIIGWVGLIMPHIARMAFGPDHRTLVPFSIVIGACFMVLADVLARTLAAFEIPIGIVTTLLGVPFFLYLFRKTGGGEWHA